MADEDLLMLAISIRAIRAAADRELADTLVGDWVAIATRHALTEIIAMRNEPENNIGVITEMLADLAEVTPTETVTADLVHAALNLPFREPETDTPF